MKRARAAAALEDGVGLRILVGKGIRDDAVMGEQVVKFHGALK
jgi:hypothetical protein